MKALIGLQIYFFDLLWPEYINMCALCWQMYSIEHEADWVSAVRKQDKTVVVREQPMFVLTQMSFLVAYVFRHMTIIYKTESEN